MKKTLLVVGLILVLVSSVFVLTGCDKGGSGENGKKGGRATQEITYEAPSIYKVKVSVPCEKSDSGEEVPVYLFTEELPEDVSDLFYGGGTYLVGDKVVVSFDTSSYTYHTGVAYKEAHGDVDPSFESFKEYINSDEYTGTIENPEEVKIGGREALKYECRQGAGNGDLYGYYYAVNIDDIYPYGYMTITVVTADGNSESTETVFADSEVQAIIDSMVIEGLE